MGVCGWFWVFGGVCECLCGSVVVVRVCGELKRFVVGCGFLG